MEKWHTRLLRRIVELGWTKVEFAKRSGLPKDRVYKYLQGGVKRPPHESDIASMAKAVRWTPAKLMYNIDPPEYAGGAEAAANEEPPSMRRIPRIEWGDVSMLTTNTARAKAHKLKGNMPVPEDDVSDEAFYTTAPDDANAPDIQKGDLLICDPKRKPIPGRYVIAMINGHDVPILAKYAVERYEKGEPVALALVFRDERSYGKHVLKMSDVRIIGSITHRTSRM